MTHRLGWLDTWRGLAVVHMVAYHTLWDLVYLFGWEISWFETDTAFYWEQWIAWSFILVSGICAARSRHLFRRGLEIFGLGSAITVVTLGVGGDAVIQFGVLSLLGASMILTAAIQTWLQRMAPSLGFGVMLVLFYLTYWVPQGFIQLFPVSLALHESWYANLFTSFLGFKAPDFYSADYFPLLPWFFLYGAGYMLGRWMRERDSLSLPSVKEPIFSRIGRKALMVYLAHQPVIYGVLTLVDCADALVA